MRSVAKVAKDLANMSRGGYKPIFYRKDLVFIERLLSILCFSPTTYHYRSLSRSQKMNIDGDTLDCDNVGSERR